jgi:hypothetical protein
MTISPYDNPFSDWTPCEEDGIDDGVMFPGVGGDAPVMADADESVGSHRRRVQCVGCGDVVELPARMVRGVAKCGCGRLRVVATSLSGHQYSNLDGFGVYGCAK